MNRKNQENKMGMNIQWYPGHMTKTKRQLAPKLKLIHLVIIVLDARAPKSSYNEDFDKLFEGKEKIFVLNKSDLADTNITKSWLEYYRKKGCYAISYSAAKMSPKVLLSEISSIADKISLKYEAKGMNKIIRGLVAGVPNVGKSAILNRLSGGKKVKEGNKPGVTRGLQWVRITDHLEIMDSPGLLAPKLKDEKSAANVAFIGCIKQEILDEESLCYYLLQSLMKTAPKKLMERYRLEYLESDAYEVMGQISKKRGFLVKGGEFDIERCAKVVLDEFKNGKIGCISLEKPTDDM